MKYFKKAMGILDDAFIPMKVYRHQIVINYLDGKDEAELKIIPSSFAGEVIVCLYRGNKLRIRKSVALSELRDIIEFVCVDGFMY